MTDPTPTVALTKTSISLLQAVAGPVPRRPCLIAYSGAEVGQPFHLDPGRTLLGRAPDCQIHLDHPGISRRHAALEVTDTEVVLTDLGSVNGTLVNETRIQGPCTLKDGDLVRTGLVVMRFYESRSLEAALHDRVYRMATIDSCTEIFNRRYLLDTLRREMRLALLQQQPLSLIVLDLDHFKSVNDRYGHAMGDVVLRDCAAIVRATVQERGVLGRLGGEEFAVLLPQRTLADALLCGEAICQAVAAHAFSLRPPGESALVTHRQTLSAGVAQLDDGMAEPSDLLAAADRKLYASKHAGRNRVSG